MLLAVLGFGAVTQVRSTEVNDTYAGYRQEALISVLNGLAGTTQRAETEVARLEETREQLQTDTSAEQAAIEQARTEIDTLEVLAGTVPVTGPGIRITITEETGPVDINSLLDTVQEMRTAFAEAMQINGQVRIVASTSFEDGTGGIYVDGTLLEPPYVIDVIGDPATLQRRHGVPRGSDRAARGRRCRASRSSSSSPSTSSRSSHSNATSTPSPRPVPDRRSIACPRPTPSQPGGAPCTPTT